MALVFKSVLRWYDGHLQRHPYVTQILTNGPLWAAGDWMAQQLQSINMHSTTLKDQPLQINNTEAVQSNLIQNRASQHQVGKDLIVNEEKKIATDWYRVARFGFYGFFVAGPLYAWWYGYIERRWLHLKLQGREVKYTLAKVAYDQLLFEPPYLIQFFTTMGILKGMNFDEIKNMIKEEYTTTFVANCLVWPILQGINFTCVPVRFQAIYVNLVSLGWAGFLSWVTNKPTGHV